MKGIFASQNAVISDSFFKTENFRVEGMLQ